MSRAAVREVGPGLRLLGFGAVLVVMFGAGVGLGVLVGPVGDVAPAPHATQTDQPDGH